MLRDLLGHRNGGGLFRVVRLNGQHISSRNQPARRRTKGILDAAGIGAHVVSGLAGVQEMVRGPAIGPGDFAAVDIRHEAVVAVHGQV